MMTADQITDRREVIWNLVLQYSGIGFMVVQGIVLVPVYLRFVGSAEFGVWLVANSVATWIAIIDPGISALMQQRVSRALGSARPAHAARLAWRGLRLNAALAALMIVAGAGAASWLAGLIDPGVAVPVRTGGWLVFLSVAGVAAGLMANALTVLGVALRDARSHTIVALASAVAGLAATLGGLALGWGVLALAAGKFMRLDGHHLAAVAVGVVLVAKAHVALIDTQQTVVGDGDAMGVTAQIVEDLVGTAEGLLGVDHPGFLMQCIEQALPCAGICEFGIGPGEFDVLL